MSAEIIVLDVRTDLEVYDRRITLPAKCPFGDRALLVCLDSLKCVLPEVDVIGAASVDDAIEFARIAALTGDISTCMAGKSYDFQPPLEENIHSFWSDGRAANRVTRRSLQR